MMELFSLEELSSRSAYKQDYGLESSIQYMKLRLFILAGALYRTFLWRDCPAKEINPKRTVNKSLFLPAKYKNQFMTWWRSALNKVNDWKLNY